MANRKVGSALLYPAATGLERAMADVDADRLTDIYAEAVTDVWDPFKISAQNLPYLAWAMAVNLWVDGWREETKRNWVARQWEFQNLRGTLAGAKMAVDFVGRDVSPFGYEVLSATTPPQRVFSGPRISAAEREAWLEILPQLRVWHINESGTAKSRQAFYGSDSSTRQYDARFCTGGEAADDSWSFAIPSTAAERFRRRARWIVAGVEQDCTIESIGTYWQLHLPSKEGRKIFSGRPMREDRFYIPSDAWRRLVTIRPNPILPWRSEVGPSLEPISSSPDVVVQSGVQGYSVFSDLPMGLRAFYIPTTAPMRVFDRYAINTGEVGPHAPRPAVQIMNRGRYGFPKYTAWLRCSIPGRRRPWAAGEGIPVGKYWIPHDNKPVERVRNAVMAASRLADKVLLDIGPRPKFVAGGTPVRAGVSHIIVGKP